MNIESNYREESGDYEIEASVQNATLRFKILDKTDGAEVLTGGVALDATPHREELFLLVRKYLRKFAELNP
jgi:hypothetical protein